MATRIFCDGCDQQLGENGVTHNIRKILIESEDQTDVNLVVDLCNRCLSYLKGRANPKLWDRVALAA
jgi:hypothetical protein